jgi:hypothetical protein
MANQGAIAPKLQGAKLLLTERFRRETEKNRAMAILSIQDCEARV